MSYEMSDLLDLVVEQNASDLHLQVGQPPTLRLSGSMVPIEGPNLTPNDTEKLMLAITPDSHISNVKLNGGADFGFAFGEKARSLGMRTMREDGARKAIAGLTTIEEVVSITVGDAS